MAAALTRKDLLKAINQPNLWEQVGAAAIAKCYINLECIQSGGNTQR